MLTGEVKMRTDYLLYGVALTCIVLAVCLGFLSLTYPAITLVILGVILAGVGYTLRPKEAVVETPSAATVPSQGHVPPTPVPEPTPTVEKKSPIELVEVKGIGPKRSEQLKSLGILTVQDLAKASAEELASKLEVSPKITTRWIKEAKRLLDET